MTGQETRAYTLQINLYQSIVALMIHHISSWRDLINTRRPTLLFEYHEYEYFSTPTHSLSRLHAVCLAKAIKLHKDVILPLFRVCQSLWTGSPGGSTGYHIKFKPILPSKYSMS